MIISNCCSAGADSMANPLTGVVTRKDTVTGQAVAASIRPTSGQPVQPVAPVSEVNGPSVAASAMSVLLAGQMV